MLRSFRALHTLLSENQRGQVQRLLQNTLRGGGGQAILKLLEQIEHAVTKYNDSVKRVVTENNTIVNDLREKGVEKDKTIIAINEEKKGLVADFQEQTKELELTRQDLAATKTDLDKTKAELEKKMEKIQSLEDNSKQTESELHQQLTKANASNELLTNQIKNAMARLDSANVELSNIQQKTNSTLKTKISENLHGLSTQLGTLKTNIEKLQDSANKVSTKQDAYADKLATILKNIKEYTPLNEIAASS